MREFFHYDGGYTQIISKIFDALVLGLLWLLLCLPVITAGAATTALYYALIKSLRNNRGYAVREFWHGFRTNWRQATVIWIVMAALFIACIGNLRILSLDLVTANEATAFLLVLYIAVLIVVVAFALYVFPSISRFEGTVLWFVRLALFMTVRYLGTTLICLLVLLMAGILIWRLPILILLLPSGVCYLISTFMERVLKRHEPA